MARQQLILDRYRIIDKAGAGGGGTVQHAYDTRLKRDVAIKCIELSQVDIARANLLVMEARLQDNLASAAQNNVSATSDTPDKDEEADLFEIDEDIDYFDPDSDISETNENGQALNTYNIPPTAEATKVLETPQNPDNKTETKSDVDINNDNSLFEHVPGLAEARTAAHLNDNNIVTVYDFEVYGSTAYVIMEYIEGKTLARIMKEMGDSISLDVIAAVFSSVSHALEVAHDNDVLHLDIKPENVIVTEKGVVKVTDFGLSTLTDASGQATTGGGTIGYMPLEQMRQEPLDVRTDEWALASLTYEMLTGTNPFFAANLQDAERAIEDAELILPSLCWDALNPMADDIIFDALDPDPDERFDSIADFDEELTPLLGNANAGKKTLAAVVRDEAEEMQGTASWEPTGPKPPIIDRIGPVGASVIMRILAILGTVFIAAIALFNIRFETTLSYGIADQYTLLFWVVIAICIALAAIRPMIGMMVAFVLFIVMLLFNQAYVVGIIMLVALGVWWLLYGRHNDGSCTIVLLQPLAGSIGMSPLSTIVAGTILNVRDATITTIFAIISAIMFASLGSSDLMTWDITSNMLTPIDPSVSGGNITDAFIATIVSPATWCIALSWILAAVEYALFCERGSRAFDIAGAIVATFILFAGIVIGTGIEDLLGSIFADTPTEAPASVSWLPSITECIGILIPGIIGVILALLNVPDRARLEKDEWQKMVNSAKSNFD